MWIEISDEYVNKLKNMSRRKIKLNEDYGGGKEQWAYWDKKEGCFFWAQGEAAVYMDDLQQRPTHIWISK